MLRLNSVLKNIVFSSSKFRVQFFSQASASSSDDSLKAELLSKSLKFVPELGWNDECIVRAVQELNLPPISHKIVQRGAGEMLQYFQAKKLISVETQFQQEFPDYNEMYCEDRLYRAMELHIENLQPFKAVWPEALALLVHPTEVPYALTTAMNISNSLCQQAGIRSSRLDWYYERMVLMSLYGSVELYFLTDGTDNLQDTR
jgi:ubiquinone biosynthesis protein COQ9